MARPIRADEIKEVLRKKHQGETFLTEVKTGPTLVQGKSDLQKLDALAIKPSWSNPCFTAYEVKVSRSDFLRDDKWTNYLNYCHKFYWACPSGLIKPEEVAERCGLVWVNDDGGWSVRKAAVFRKIEIPWEMLYYIILYKTDEERHPFFSSRRDFLEAYVQDKHERWKLSYHVSTKWAAELKAMEKKLEESQDEVSKAQRGMAVIKVLEEFGIRFGRYHNTEFELDKLRERLQGTVPPNLLDDARMAANYAQRVLRAVEPPKSKEADAS